METKNPTQKILTIVASAIILISFFLPWVGTFGQTVSAAAIIEQVLKSLEYIGKMNDDQALYILIPLSLLVMPICSLVILIREAANMKNKSGKGPKVIMAIVMSIYLVFLIYTESKNPFSGHGGSVFSALGIGFYLTLISVIYLFVSVFMKENTVNQNINNIPVNSQRYCSGCGKSYHPSNASQFCENCGAKL